MVTLDMDKTICPPTTVINPQAMLIRYEERLETKKKSKELRDFSGDLFSLSPSLFKESSMRSIFTTPFKNIEFKCETRETIVENPMSFIKMYEENRNLPNHNPKRNLQDGKYLRSGNYTLSSLSAVDNSLANYDSSPLLNTNKPVSIQNEDWGQLITNNQRFSVDFDSNCKNLNVNIKSNFYPSNSSSFQQPQTEDATSFHLHQQNHRTNFENSDQMYSRNQAKNSSGVKDKISLPFSQTLGDISPQVYSPAIDASPQFYSAHQKRFPFQDSESSESFSFHQKKASPLPKSYFDIPANDRINSNFLKKTKQRDNQLLKLDSYAFTPHY